MLHTKVLLSKGFTCNCAEWLINNVGSGNVHIRDEGGRKTISKTHAGQDEVDWWYDSIIESYHDPDTGSYYLARQFVRFKNPTMASLFALTWT